MYHKRKTWAIIVLALLMTMLKADMIFTPNQGTGDPTQSKEILPV